MGEFYHGDTEITEENSKNSNHKSQIYHRGTEITEGNSKNSNLKTHFNHGGTENIEEKSQILKYSKLNLPRGHGEHRGKISKSQNLKSQISLVPPRITK